LRRRVCQIIFCKTEMTTTRWLWWWHKLQYNCKCTNDNCVACKI